LVELVFFQSDIQCICYIACFYSLFEVSIFSRSKTNIKRRGISNCHRCNISSKFYVVVTCVYVLNVGVNPWFWDWVFVYGLYIWLRLISTHAPIIIIGMWNIGVI